MISRYVFKDIVSLPVSDILELFNQCSQITLRMEHIRTLMFNCYWGMNNANKKDPALIKC